MEPVKHPNCRLLQKKVNSLQLKTIPATPPPPLPPPPLITHPPHLQLSYREYSYLKQALENYRFCRNTVNDANSRG